MSILDERVLILTSTRKDSESTCKLLKETPFHPYACENFDELLENIHMGAAVLLLAKEVLIASNLDRLAECLNEQESWSDLPIVILASAGDLTQEKSETLKVLKVLRNTTILERPVRIATLLSILETSVVNRKRQYEVRNLLQELVQARQEAELAKGESDRANRTKSEFLANMSHEIRTPLGVILGFTELASDETITTEERKAYTEAVQRNGKLLLALVNDILDLAKVEAGGIATEYLETSVLDILKDVIAGFKTTAAQKGVEISMSLQKDFPMTVKTDPTRVRQIFMNVLGNAVKFTRQGTISMDLSITEVSHEKSRLSLLVTDTGMGISETQQKKLFQPFSQADSSTTRKFGGSGLGLVLSRQLARVLGGDLRLVGSIPGVGSKFEVSLEIGNVFASDHQAQQDPLKTEFQIAEGLKFLLAEDSPDNQVIISRILSLAGGKVELAHNGIEVVEKALRSNFDIILMDLQMPYLDGNEATRRLRDQGYQKPIIALTANALKGDKERAMDNGFDDYITKPIQRKDLFESLSRFSRQP